MPEDKPQGFVISDRRSFTAEGEPRDKPPAPEAAIDFATFIMSLGSSALMHLGQVPGPGGKPSEKNLPLAKQSIDILSLIQEKTKGNLTNEEAGLLEELLYDLRLRYVNASKQG